MWKLHQIDDDGVYKNLRYDRIRFLEEPGGVPHLTPYRDPAGCVDIGIGFKIDSNWNEILPALGIDISEGAPKTEKDFIQELKDIVGKDQTFTQFEIDAIVIPNLDWVMERRGGRAEFKFNDLEEVRATFDLIADKNERKLAQWTTTRGIGFDRSDESMALLDLVYCNVIGLNTKKKGNIIVTTPKCPKLLDALQQVNRPEAWFEIRYNSNKERTTNPNIAPGIAKRRYYESDLFNLYDPYPKTDEEMILEDKTIFSMYWRHKDRIESYDKTLKFGAQISAANNDYRVDWVKSFADDVKSSKDDIIFRFARGQSIDNVFVGKGLST